MKRWKKLTTGILAIMMTVSTVNISIVGAEEITPITNDGLGLGDISQDTDVSHLQDTTISPVFVETPDQASDFTETPIDIPAGDESVTLIYPVTIPEKGAVTFMLMQKDTIDFSSITMELYTDVACTEKQGNFSLFSGEPYTGDEIFCSNAGTYYLKAVFERKYGVTDEKHFMLDSIFISNANRDLAEEVLAIAYSDYENKDITYKVQVKKTGVLAFGALPSDYTSSFTGYVTLYDENKKAISSKEYISNNDDSSSEAKYARAYYTVKKGTYYIKFSAYSSTAHYIVGYSLVDAKDTSGASKSKATKLTIGSKAKSGMVFTSDSKKKTDWYKLTLTKNKKFTIVVDSYVSGKLKMEVCDSKGRTVLFGTKTLTTAQYKLPTKGKWSKGTYYIKVTKDNNKSSGYYEIKVK